MKFVKENLTLVICGAVVLLALVAWLVWPLPSMRNQLQADMNERYSDKGTVDRIGNTQLQLPGQSKPVVGAPNASWVKAKKALIERVTMQEKEVEGLSHEINSHGRVAKGVPILPMAVASGKSWAWGKAEPGVLPKVTSTDAAISFKHDYINQFAEWASILAKGSLPKGENPDAVIRSCSVPTPEELKDMFAADQKSRAQILGDHRDQNTGGGGQADSAQEQRFDRDTLLRTANQLRMYVDRTAFQVRTWYSSEEPPTDTQIFNATVDSWLQADVVRAIYEVNNPGGKAPANVGEAPIKRLMHISVGNSARAHVVTITSSSQLGSSGNNNVAMTSDPSLFYTAAEAAQAPSGSTGPVLGAAIGGRGESESAAAAAPNAIDYNVSMTGHASGGQYDVVLMSVWMDIDPAKLVEFIDRLYQQNVGYTVTNVQLKTVDPLERAGNGYIYGNGQVVEAEIQVEAILFREWTTPLMPADVKAALGVPAPAK